ncbi:hypothetical protein B0H11DRAFT_1252499 [Mycena galericulata]|nr:hypothetical protein B0H11DRAFT_1252499 [Mycena galericulata]
MENDAPPPAPGPALGNDSTLAQLRAQQIISLNLEGQIAVLKLQLEHGQEDVAAARQAAAAACRDSVDLRMRYDSSQRELTEVRGKYEALKRRCHASTSSQPPGLKRKCEGEQDGGEHERERRGSGENFYERPAMVPPTNSPRAPDDAIVVRKTSLSLPDERDPVWPPSPVVPAPEMFPSSTLPLPLSHPPDADRPNDPRKRIKLDSHARGHAPCSPELQYPDLPSHPNLNAGVLPAPTTAPVPVPRKTSSSSSSSSILDSSIARERFPARPPNSLPPRPTTATGAQSTFHSGLGERDDERLRGDGGGRPFGDGRGGGIRPDPHGHGQHGGGGGGSYPNPNSNLSGHSNARLHSNGNSNSSRSSQLGPVGRSCVR